MRYDYSVVRFVPDGFRGEFVNVGVIVGSSETGEWQARRVGNSIRATRLSEGASAAAVWAYLDDVERRIDDVYNHDADPQELGRTWLEGEYRRLRNLVQLSPPTRVVADDVDEAMNLIFSELVVDPVRPTRNTRTRTVAELRSAYRNRNIEQEFLHERVSAQVGMQSLTVDFAVGNGHLAQLAQAWSFQRRTPSKTVEQIRSWTWTLSETRDTGGQVVVPGRVEPYEVNADVDIDVVYDIPDTDDGRRALDQALDVFDRLNVTAYSVNDVDRVAQEAAERLHASHQA